MEDKQQTGTGFDQLKKQRNEKSRKIVNIVMPILAAFIPPLFGFILNVICTISSIVSLVKDEKKTAAIFIFLLNLVSLAINSWYMITIFMYYA